MRVVASWCVLFTSIAGCAPMLRAEQVIDTPLPEQVSRQPEAGSATIEVDAAIAGDRLIVTLVRSRTCLEVTTPRVARARHVTRRPDPKWTADRPESLARPRALEALAIIATRRASAQLVEGTPAVRGVRDDDLAADLRDPASATRARGLSRDVALHGIALHDDAPPLRTLWSGIVRDPAVLVLQGYDPEERQLVTRFHRFAAGRIVPLALDASPEIARQLATEGPIVELALDASGTGTVRQIGRGAVPVLTTQPSSVYRAGDRVRVPRLDHWRPRSPTSATAST